MLDSWKAIADYLQRDVRTLQRWERTKGLPLHRLPGGCKPRVYALKTELDAWLGWQHSGSPPPLYPTIAVLPFLILSAELEAQYFTDGLADGIITALAQVEGLNVTARTSSFAFRGRECDARQIGAALDADVLLEGSVQWSREAIRVSAQLVDVNTGTHLWGELFDRPKDNPFEAQADITRCIVGGLMLKLADG